MNIQSSIKRAIESCNGNADIRITSNLYDEQLTITQPDLVLMPKERGGEVTIKQKENRCICIDVGKGNKCTIKNLRMLLKGPNLDANIESFQTNMDFEKRGNKDAMKEFFTHMPDKMYCIIMVKSGTLILRDCQLSLE